MSNVDAPRYVLTLACPDTTGIVAAVANFLAENHALLIEASHFNDEHTDRSFMRTVFHDNGEGMPTMAELDSLFVGVAERFKMTWRFHNEADPLKTLIAVSKAGHCLSSLLHRWSVGSLPIEIVGIVSNHETLKRHADWHKIPFTHLPIEKGHEAEQQDALHALFESSGAELLVLARYMRILSSEMCGRLKNRCINIHHSFLRRARGPHLHAFRADQRRPRSGEHRAQPRHPLARRAPRLRERQQNRRPQVRRGQVFNLKFSLRKL
jgi:formyltetrahydrofolate deformylase